MGLLKKLIGTATVAGAGVAAVKVAEKIKENNAEGITDVNGDGKIDYQDYLLEAKKAAAELYGENAPKVKEAAEEKLNALKEKYPDAVGKIDDVVATVREKAEEIKDKVK